LSRHGQTFPRENIIRREKIRSLSKPFAAPANRQNPDARGTVGRSEF